MVRRIGGPGPADVSIWPYPDPQVTDKELGWIDRKAVGVYVCVEGRCTLVIVSGFVGWITSEFVIPHPLFK